MDEPFNLIMQCPALQGAGNHMFEELCFIQGGYGEINTFDLRSYDTEKYV